MAEAQVGRGYLRWDQFGMTKDEMRLALKTLGKAGVSVKGLHFHLQTVPRKVGDYRDAIEHLALAAEELEIDPEYIDIGGGVPVHGETTKDGISLAAQFDMTQFRRMLGRIPLALPSVRGVWMENGRFLSGPAGALVVTVLDKKERDDMTYLICDGGRVNHARMAATEIHEILLMPLQGGPRRLTVVCGPTCGAVDRLGRWDLPESVQPGDRLIWQGAGAYHIPLETRFSSGLAPVVWFDAKGDPEVIRERETAKEWWGHWKSPAKTLLEIAG
jgi:diaminopimelate decarboxylase